MLRRGALRSVTKDAFPKNSTAKAIVIVPLAMYLRVDRWSNKNSIVVVSITMARMMMRTIPTYTHRLAHNVEILYLNQSIIILSKQLHLPQILKSQRQSTTELAIEPIQKGLCSECVELTVDGWEPKIFCESSVTKLPHFERV